MRGCDHHQQKDASISWVVNVAKKPTWFVRLGQPEWARHTYPRSAGDALQLLGSVRRGMQIGALAKTETGEYVQVVGDFVTPLNKRIIELALSRAKITDGGGAPRMANKVAPAPVVTVKRRRIPLPA